MYNDFYKLVKRAKSRSEQLKLLKRWNGDPRLRLKISERPVIISPKAFFQSESALNSLQRICKTTLRTGCEVPFTCLIGERGLRIAAVVRGVLGTPEDCDWEKGPLLEKSFAAARAGGLRIMLGHTHPKDYGAVCSDVHYLNFAQFGADYTSMRRFMAGDEVVSRFHIIMSPHENQIGVFELKAGGIVVYHPWKVEACHAEP